jgi:predicted DsbA family dithiol-disulfide isomerase
MLTSGVEIEIYSDVVCPWCYLGKRRLERALESFDGEVTLRWRAYQLDPSAPHECAPLIGWLGARYGGPDRARQMFSHATDAATAEGMHFDFEKALIANSFTAHRLIWWAGTPQAVVFGADADTQATLVEAVHRAHFTEGLDIGSTEVAETVGLDARRVRELLEGDEGVAEVRAELAEAGELGITSVPTFIFAGKYPVTGAQDAGTLLAVLNEVAVREGLRPTLVPAGGIPSPRRSSEDHVDHVAACEDDSCTH